MKMEVSAVTLQIEVSCPKLASTLAPPFVRTFRLRYRLLFRAPMSSMSMHSTLCMGLGTLNLIRLLRQRSGFFRHEPT